MEISVLEKSVNEYRSTFGIDIEKQNESTF